jgi:hypothetical protein
VKEPGIASVAANCLDRKLSLVDDGQREEVVRLGEGFRDQPWVDTVVDYIEEAHVAARRANFCGDPCQGGAIAFAQGSEIDDWQCVLHNQPLSIRPAPHIGQAGSPAPGIQPRARSHYK